MEINNKYLKELRESFPRFCYTCNDKNGKTVELELSDLETHDIIKYAKFGLYTPLLIKALEEIRDKQCYNMGGLENILTGLMRDIATNTLDLVKKELKS